MRAGVEPPPGFALSSSERWPREIDLPSSRNVEIRVLLAPLIAASRPRSLARESSAAHNHRLVAALIAWASPASGQENPDSKELVEILARPVSPGRLMMLIPHVKDQRVPEQWRRALSNTDPRVRRIVPGLLQMAQVRGRRLRWNRS